MAGVFFTVIQTATIAAVGVAFSKFAAYLFPVLSENNIIIDSGWLTVSAAQVVSIILIVLLTYINTKGLQGGKLIQRVFTSTKLVALFGLIVFGFILAKHSYWSENWATGFNAMQQQKNALGEFIENGTWTSISGTALIGAIAAAMAGSIFSSDAWNNVTFIAGEIKNPQKNIGLSLFLGTLIVTVIYVCANLMYLNVVPLHGIADSENNRVALTAAKSIFGDAGTYIIALLIMVSTFGCNNGLILAGARVYNTMAIDGLFFKKAAILNKNAVPEVALWAQCIMACLLCLSGTYGKLLDMISFVVVLFYALTIAGIFKLRKDRPDAERPYKAFGYPVLPAVYIILAITFCIFLIKMSPLYAGIGLGIVLLGIPVYYFVVYNKKKV
jgi:basic amino acid/polyamine antiporter, APA family